MGWRPLVVAAVGLSMPLLILPYVFLATAYPALDTGWVLLGAAIAWLLTVRVVMEVICHVLLRERIRCAIRRELNASHIPTCMRCGYVFGVPGVGSCPECGASVNS